MLKRLFFTVDISEEERDHVLCYHQKVERLLKKSAKMVPVENLHITLFFLGSVRQEKFSEIIEKARSISYNTFTINFSRAGIFPKKKNLAKLIWIEGKGSDAITLCDKIKKTFTHHEGDVVTPHITIARIRKWDLQRTPPYLLDEVEEELCLTVNVNSFSLMESRLTKNGLTYSKVETFSLTE